jgi:hypothetical protein
MSVVIRYKIREELLKVYGTVDDYLDKVYLESLTNKLEIDNIELRREWLTYNQIILELKHNIKDLISVKELQYKLTDDEDPIITCLQFLKETKHHTDELERLYFKIKNF